MLVLIESYICYRCLKSPKIQPSLKTQEWAMNPSEMDPHKIIGGKTVKKVQINEQDMAKELIVRK